MRTFFVAVVVALLLALGAACSGDVEDEAATESEPPPTLTAPFEADDALIQLTDLPTGWQREATSDDDADDDAGDFCGVSDENQADALDEAEVQYLTGSGLNEVLFEHGVFAYAPGVAEERMDFVRDAVADCRDGFTANDLEWSVSELSFPQLGDESVALSMTATITEDVPFPVDLRVFIVGLRVADGISSVIYGGVGPEVAEAERFARLAEEKLLSASQG